MFIFFDPALPSNRCQDAISKWQQAVIPYLLMMSDDEAFSSLRRPKTVIINPNQDGWVIISPLNYE